MYKFTCILAARESRFKMVTQGSRCVAACRVCLGRERRCAEDTDQPLARLVADLVGDKRLNQPSNNRYIQNTATRNKTGAG